MKHSPILMILLLFLIGIIASAAACGHVENTAPGETSTEDIILEGLEAAQGGNLHYQNLVLAVGDQIVFNSADGLLTFASSDGTNAMPVIDSAGSSPAYDGDQLFYISGTSGGQLCKVALDGSNQIRIGQTTLKYLISTNDTLYAIESDSGLPISLKPDGTGRIAISETQAIALTLADERLFVTGAASENGLTMIELATGEQTILLDRQISSLNVSGDWLYFADPAKDFQLSAWSVTGRSGGSISSFGVEKAFVVSAGYLYYIDTGSQSRLYRLAVDGARSLDGQSPDLVIDDAVSSFVVCGDAVYYQRPSSSRIYKAPVAGGTPMRIT